ncbi:MAG: Esterase [Planctomycetaceae bacterium]|nr:Esterase [Planctomycetaceae bacterium]
MFTICRWIAVIGLLGGQGGQILAADPPMTNEALKQLLKQFPKADTNGDGVLTQEEAKAYRAVLLKAEAAKKSVSPTKSNVSYGPYQRNVLDFYQAESKTPTPLIIFIHGGGFVAGDKTGVIPEFVRGALTAGISFASINYRFVDGKEVIFPAPQHDGARAVQFLRTKASEWNLDPKHFACIGGSAGAGISMWIGFHDDLADPRNSDPVLRQSTRIQAIGTLGGQGTYDPIQIKELIGGRAWEHPSLIKVYGLKSNAEALNPNPEMQRRYDESSAITHLTKDDPGLYMVYNESEGPLPAKAGPGDGIHHPNFGKQLKKKMDELGIANVYVNTTETKGVDVGSEMIKFIQEQFAKSK